MLIRVASIIAMVGLAAVAEGSERPNILLFLADDLGWTDWQRDPSLNPEGSLVYETPNLLRLAQQGVTFSEGYSAAAVCSPTRAAIMTGQAPARLRVTDYIPGSNSVTSRLAPPKWNKSLSLSERTLPERLGDAGYSTGFVGKWHLGLRNQPEADPVQHGFDWQIGGNHDGHPGRSGGFFAGEDGMWDGLPGLETPGAYAPDTYLSDVLTDHAEGYIQQQAGDEPFFLMVSEYLVHTPIEAPADLVSKYAAKIQALSSDGVDLRDHDDAVYAAMVEKMDQSLGRLLDRLDDPNGDGDAADSIRDNTLVLFASDNGGLWASEGSPTRNLPLREGKGSIHEGGIRTPLFASWTGNGQIGQGEVNETIAISHDLTATALDAAGLDVAGLDGVSFLPALEGDPSGRGPVFWHYPHRSPQDVNAPEINRGHFYSAVRDGDWKLIYRYGQEDFLLYNLARGPRRDDQPGRPASRGGSTLARVAASLVDRDRRAAADGACNTQADFPAATDLVWRHPGDFNGDGAVDAADYTVWRNAVESAGAVVVDANEDLRTDEFDLRHWRANYGAVASQPPASVPEPAAAGLLVALFGGLSIRRHHCG